ncbi:MAG: hypothetical protein FWC01_04370 [Treponema sp.]|nr:hypothetical protein [Treponema sp.]MCL2237777.1 hypothetical protein [Treponema sp.]
MFLQISTLIFAVQWLGSPFQLGLLKAFLSCFFFLTMIILSIVPAMSREWRMYIRSFIVCALLQLLFLFLNFVLPGIGLVMTIIYNIVLFFISKKLPVSFTNNIKSGLIFFVLWFMGINHLLGSFLLSDPRGVWSGDIYFSAADWVILAIFLCAIARTIYHIASSGKILETAETQENEKAQYTQDLKYSSDLQKREKKTLLPVLAVSAILLIISAFVKLPWEAQAVNDLRTGFAAINENNIEEAEKIAVKYYNDKAYLFNGDVFYLNARLKEIESQKDAIQFYIRAVNWYKNHKSWVSQDYHEEAKQRLAQIYTEENIGFFGRLWRNIRARF